MSPSAGVGGVTLWTPRARLLGLLLVVLAGIVVRALHFSAIQGTAFIDFPLAATQSDMWGWWTWSGEILAGDVWGKDPWHPYFGWMADWGSREDWYRWWGDRLTFQLEPFYAYWLAALRSLGAGLSQIIGLQLAISTLAAVPVYFLTRRFTSDLGALVAAALVVLYGPLVFYAGTLLRDVFSSLIDPSLVLFTLVAARARRRPVPWVALGAAMGAALLVKYTTLLLAAGLAAWSLADARRDRAELAMRAGTLALGLVLGLAPLLARNAVIGAPLFQVCNRPLESFVMANVADVEPIGMKSSPGDALEVLRKADGRMSRALVETWRTYDGDVALFLSRQWLRLRAIVDPFEIPNNLSFAYGVQLSPLLGRLPGWGLLLPLGLAGVIVCLLAAPRRHAVLLIYGVTVAAAAGVQFALDRYRLPLAVFLCVAAGVLVGELHQRLRQRRWQPAAGAAVVIAIAVALQQVILPLEDHRQQLFYAVHPLSYNVSTMIYLQRGDLTAAMAQATLLRRQAERHPELSSPIDRLAAGIEGAVLIDAAVMNLGAGNRDAARTLLLKGETALRHATDDPGMDVQLALLHEQLGHPQDARQRARRYLESQPEGPHAAEARALLQRLAP